MINHPLFYPDNIKNIKKDVEVLQIIAQKKTYIEEIVKTSKITIGYVKSSIRRLEAFGLVNKEREGKIVLIELTPEGQRIADRLQEGGE